LKKLKSKNFGPKVYKKIKIEAMVFSFNFVVLKLFVNFSKILAIFFSNLKYKKNSIYLSPQIKNSFKKNVESKTHHFQLIKKNQ
jgi:hypothetical protein